MGRTWRMSKKLPNTSHGGSKYPKLKNQHLNFDW
jgi:hypothetical protein